jgi:hypothetical protein
MTQAGQGATDVPASHALAMAHTLMVDAVTAEVVTALGTRRVRAIVLKGPSLANWLYDADELRSYGDCDLLVGPRDLPTAETVLAGLGFAKQLAELAGENVLVPWAQPWRRGRGVVDLHTSYYGIGVRPDSAWRALSDATEAAEIANVAVEILSPAPRTLLIALHAAYHAGKTPRAMQDLERAVRRLPDELWRDAVELAGRLQALEGLAAGLTLTEPGAALADRLGVAGELSPMAALRRTEVGEGFARLSLVPGLPAKARILARELFPSPAFLRWQTSLARRSRRGLVAAYVWRWWWLASKAPRSYLAFRRTRSPRREA